MPSTAIQVTPDRLLLRSRPRQRQGVDALRCAAAGGAAERRAERAPLQRTFDLLREAVAGWKCPGETEGTVETEGNKGSPKSQPEDQIWICLGIGYLKVSWFSLSHFASSKIAIHRMNIRLKMDFPSLGIPMT